ncbi:MAG: hypothetical protein ACP5HK_00150 [Acidilobus sp.]
MARGAYTVYKALVELLGLRQVDVYRVHTRGSPSDILRVLEPSSRRVFEVNLNTTRESLSYEEFLSRIREAAEKEGVRISDRLWTIAITKAKSLARKTQPKS